MSGNTVGSNLGINDYPVIAYANRGVELSLGNVLKFDGWEFDRFRTLLEHTVGETWHPHRPTEIRHRRARAVVGIFEIQAEEDVILPLPQSYRIRSVMILACEN